MGGSKPNWSISVNAKIGRPRPSTSDAGRVAAMFGLAGERGLILYDRFRLRIAPGEIVAVVGPSGAGKSVLLREAARRIPRSRWLRTEELSRLDTPAVDTPRGIDLPVRLEMLSRCGLADAQALVTPARLLSGGQLYRLALADALLEDRRRSEPTLVIADEFAAGLDTATAWCLCRQIRKRIGRSKLSLLVATPRGDLLEALAPDQVVVKPLMEPARIVRPIRTAGPRGDHVLDAQCWPIEAGSIRDYRLLAAFHYLSGPPAAHKRVYVVRVPPGARGPASPSVAAVLVVSPPLGGVRGRNLALGGRYSGPDRLEGLRRLNREIECISRVIVHPIYRGCGLAVRLVRHAIGRARTPMVEALAAMGALHPFFERAGMEAFRPPPDKHVLRLLSAAAALGLSAEDVAAVAPVKRLLARDDPAGRLLAREVDRCIAKSLAARRAGPPADPVAEICRRTSRQYVYYLHGHRKAAMDEAATDATDSIATDAAGWRQ